MSEKDTAAAISGQTGIRSYYEYQQTRVPKSELGKDDFLTLLSAQLQYQDPMEPQKDTDFIAQLAQFSSLTYLQTLSETMSTSQQFNYAGKYVFAKITLGTGEKVDVEGLVDRVVMQDGKAYAQIGEYMVDCSKISEVYDKDLITGKNTLLENTNLIGKYVQGYYPDENKKPVLAEGICTRVSISDGVLVAYLDDGTKVTKVGVADIFDISDKAPVKPADNPEDTDTKGTENVVNSGGTEESEDTGETGSTLGSGDTETDPDENIVD